MTVQPFTIQVNSETLDWITQRVYTAHVIPDVKQPEGNEWADGIPSSAVNDLVDYWKSSFDWRKVEAKLNSTYKMYTLDIQEGTETINLHFVHHRSERPGAIPLLFAHGWPGNFTEVLTHSLFIVFVQLICIFLKKRLKSCLASPRLRMKANRLSTS